MSFSSFSKNQDKIADEKSNDQKVADRDAKLESKPMEHQGKQEKNSQQESAS